MSRPYMKMFWGDYLRDTAHLNTTQHGAYLLLIAFYWSKGSLPKDDKHIRQITKLSPQLWDKYKGVLMQFFVITGGAWTHKRIDAELAQAIEKSKAQSANAKPKRVPIANTRIKEEETLESKNPSPNGDGNPTMAELERAYFKEGREVLGKNAGGLLNLLLRSKQFDVHAAHALLKLARTKFDPKQFVAGAVRNFTQRKGGTNDGHAQTRGSILDATDRILRVIESPRNSGGGEKDLLGLPARPVGGS